MFIYKESADDLWRHWLPKREVVIDMTEYVSDPSKPLSIYPNPVTDYVNVGTLDMAETTIRIYSSTGQLMHEETSQVSGMEPARIDMTACPPGVYSIEVVFGGKKRSSISQER